MMMMVRAGLACAGLMIGTASLAQTITTPQPPKGEQATPMVIQSLGSEQSEVQKAMQDLQKRTDAQIQEPIGPDLDLSLSQKMMVFQRLETDFSQLVLTYALDPQLRRLSPADIDFAVRQITSIREWQLKHGK